MEPEVAARIRATANPTDAAAYEALVHRLWESDKPVAMRQALRAAALAPDRLDYAANAMRALSIQGRMRDIPNLMPTTAEPLPAPHLHTVEFEPLVALYHRLLEETDRRRREGWAPSSIEQSKFDTPLSVEHLANFRRSEVSGGTQTVPDRPLEFPFLDFSRLYPMVTDAERDRWVPELLETRAGLLFRLVLAAAGAPENSGLRRALAYADALLLDDDRFGARLFELPDIGPVTAKSLQATFYACRIHGLVQDGGSVLEIGGGFGAVAARVLRIRPDVVYMLTDLPVNMILTYAYLRSHFGEAVYGAFEGPIRPPQGCRVMVIPPWRLNELNGRASLVVNTMSFQHMDARNHVYYGEVMRHFQARRLYHLNREIISPGDRTVHIPASRYSFLDQFDIREQAAFDTRWIEVVADRKTAAA